MTILQAIILGIVQGLSEFLPISSSAHIVFTQNICAVLNGSTIDLGSAQQVFLSIMLHVGTLIAVLIYFRKEVFEITKDFFKALWTRDFSSANAKMGAFILIGTVFTVLVAYPLKDVSEKLMVYPQIVAFLLIMTGIVLFFSEFKSKHQKEHTDKLSLKHAILIGLAQGVAAFPGFSRSGWTIATGLFTGLDRVTSTKFSFLLVIPIILGTSIFYPMLEINPQELATFNWTAILIGTAVSAIVGYFCIKYFLKFVARFSMNFFAYYCIIAGLIVISFFTGIALGSN